MSDDVITNFLQSQPAANSSAQVEGIQKKGSQGVDFKQIFSHEGKKLVNDSSEVNAEGRQERQGLSAVEVLAEEGVEAIPGQNKDQAADEAGSHLPSLSIHNGALAVGRIIYTSKDIAVTNESLSKFMVRQGLVNNSLKGSGTVSAGLNTEQEVTREVGDLGSGPIKDGQGLALVGADFKHSQVSKENLNFGMDALKPNKSAIVGEADDPNQKQTASLVGQFRQFGGASLGGGELRGLSKPGSEIDTPYEVLKSGIESKAPAEALSKNLERQYLGMDATKPNKSETVREAGDPDLKQIASLVGQFGRTSGQLRESFKPVPKVNTFPDSQVVVNKVENEPSANQLADLVKQFGGSFLGSAEPKGLAKPGSEIDTPYEVLKSGIESKAPAEALSKNLERQLQFAERDQGAKLAEVKAEPPREGLKSEVLFKNKAYAQESLTKNQNVNTLGEQVSEIKKEQVHGQLQLQRFLGEIKETINVARESDNSKPMNSLGFSEPSIKGLRDAGQHAPQETVVSDLSQTRVEFKGALKEAQRLVSTNVYNNLTDSYESWSSRLGEVLASRIAGNINKENWNVQLKMNPASLGEISLQIDFSEKGLEGRLGANEEATRQLLQDTLPKLRLALRELLDANHGLKLDVGDFGNSNHQDGSDKRAVPAVIEEINFESEVLVGNTLDPEIRAVVGLNILV